MRFFHTSDWHLGRLFFGESLTEEQADLLQEFVRLAGELRPDAILISGDIYDRAVPPPEAVELLNEVLSRLVLDLKIPVLMIAGNHDSGARLSFGQRILGHKGLHVCSSVLPETVMLDDQWGPVEFVMLPYADTAAVRLALACDEVAGADAAMQLRLASLPARSSPQSRRVALAHAFLAGGQASESERPLSVGGSGAVAASHFAELDYVALGHLHRPQAMEQGRLCYSGSPLKYSFDEAAHTKGFYAVELDGQRNVKTEFIPLAARRDLRIREGLFAELMQGPAPGENREDFLRVVLHDETPVIQAIHRLRTVYPKTMEIQYRYQSTNVDFAGAGRPNHRDLSELELFAAFAEWSQGRSLTERQIEAIKPFLTRSGEGGE